MCALVEERRQLLQNANKFEYFCIDKLNSLNSGVYIHWTNIPHDILYKCGYITDFNKHRKIQLYSFKNENSIRDIGVDFIGIKDNHFISGQSKMYKGKVGLNDVGKQL